MAVAAVNLHAPFRLFRANHCETKPGQTFHCSVFIVPLGFWSELINSVGLQRCVVWSVQEEQAQQAEMETLEKNNQALQRDVARFEEREKLMQEVQPDLVTPMPLVPSKRVTVSCVSLYRCAAMYCQDRACCCEDVTLTWMSLLSMSWSDCTYSPAFYLAFSWLASLLIQLQKAESFRRQARPKLE